MEVCIERKEIAPELASRVLRYSEGYSIQAVYG
jgi:hypothetical protein